MALRHLRGACGQELAGFSIDSRRTRPTTPCQSGLLSIYLHCAGPARNIWSRFARRGIALPLAMIRSNSSTASWMAFALHVNKPTKRAIAHPAEYPEIPAAPVIAPPPLPVALGTVVRLCPQTFGIYRIPARMTERRWPLPPPAIPAAESALGLRPRSALSSAQVLQEWTTSTSPCHDFSSNGDYPLNSVSHWGSVHQIPHTRLNSHCGFSPPGCGLIPSFAGVEEYGIPD